MLKIEKVDFSFNNKDQILSQIESYCDNNEFISFIGPSGCGKTTLLNLIVGILKPDSGSIYNTYQKISYVFQQDSLLPWLNVLQNVLLPLEIEKKKINNDDKIKAKKILNELGLNDIETFFPSELSGGMRKRVELARALITEPDLLVLDEPFSSLDLLTREKLNVLLKNICLSKRLAVVLVTHSIEEACFLSDRIYVLSDKPSKVLYVFENIKNNSFVEYFYLTSEQESTENKIRNFVFDKWDNRNNFQTKKIKNKSKPNDNRNDNRIKVSNRKILIKDKRKNFKDFDNKYYNNFQGNFFEKNLYNLLIPFEIIIILILIEFIKNKFKISDFFFPAPSNLIYRFILTLKNKIIIPHIFQTILESMSGFFIAFILSILFGYLLSRSKFFYKLIMPYLIAFNTIPSVALVPFLILWFGFSIVPKIIISVIVIFFPMLINNITAFSTINQNYKHLLLFYKPNFKERFLRFELPGSLIYIFAGVKVSITLSIIGAVVGEFQTGSIGLGSLILIAKANFDTELMFVCLIWLIFLGLSYFWLANFVYKMIIKRKN